MVARFQPTLAALTGGTMKGRRFAPVSITALAAFATLSLASPSHASEPGKNAKLKPWPLIKDTKDASSPIFQTHMGKVVFSTSPIAISPKNADGFGTEFTLEKPIYSRAIFPDSMGNLLRLTGWQCRSKHTRFLAVTVNDSKSVILESEKTGKDAFDRWRTQSFASDNKKAILQGPLTWKEEGRDYSYRFTAELAPKLVAGDNVVTFQLRARCDAKSTAGAEAEKEWVVSTGTFTLKVGKGDLARFFKKRGLRLPKAAMSSPTALMKREVLRTIGRGAFPNGSVLEPFPSGTSITYANRRSSGYVVIFGARSTPWSFSKTPRTRVASSIP